VDSAFAGSAFAPEQSFTVALALAPTNGILVAGDQDGDGTVSQSEFNTVLSNYLAASPWLYLTNVAGLGVVNDNY